MKNVPYASVAATTILLLKNVCNVPKIADVIYVTFTNIPPKKLLCLFGKMKFTFDCGGELMIKNYIDYIKDSKIRQFTIKAIEKFGSDLKTERANKIAEYVEDKLKKQRFVINSPQHTLWIDLLLSATMLHNLFYDDTLVSIFVAREKLTSIGYNIGLSVESLEPIFQAIEGQLGENMPVPACRVNPNSPSGILAEACWAVEERFGEKVMPNLLKAGDHSD